MVRMYLNPNSPIPLIEFNNFFAPDIFETLKGYMAKEQNERHQIEFEYWKRPWCEKCPVMEYMYMHFIGILPRIESLLKTTIFFDDIKAVLQRTPVGMTYPIHTDTATKVGTFLTYVDPVSSAGTRFYESQDGDGMWEHPWTVNKGYFFLRNDRSFHSFTNANSQDRWVFMYNLMNKVTHRV
jgi:hypothetical protein